MTDRQFTVLCEWMENLLADLPSMSIYDLACVGEDEDGEQFFDARVDHRELAEELCRRMDDLKDKRPAAALLNVATEWKRRREDE